MKSNVETVKASAVNTQIMLTDRDKEAIYNFMHIKRKPGKMLVKPYLK